MMPADANSQPRPAADILGNLDSPGAVVVFAWWVRGGEPGPGYTSDKVEVRATEGSVIASYIRARFDQAYETSFRAEEFSGQIPLSLWANLRHSLKQETPFLTRFESELRSNVMDILKGTISVSINGQAEEKTLFGSTAEELPMVKSACNEIAIHLIDHGMRQLRSKLKKQ